MPPHCIPYAATQRFAPLVVDYLAQAADLRELFTYTPDRAGLRQAAAERRFDPASRAILCKAIEGQYEGLSLTDAVRDNLAALRNTDALTITTGHQLCLFGGPLYLTYKILNVVRMARTMTADLGRPVVPIFWMATEDHDRAEIDHTWINSTRVQWPGEAGGAVGRLPLEGIDAVVKEGLEAMGHGAHVDEIHALLLACYRPDRTLAQATRQFIHTLFGRFGVVIVDGDDAALKRLFAPIIQEELLNQVAERTVRYANERIKERYAVQAHAREINLFHLRPGHRSRIVLDGDHYQVLDGGPRWTLDELLMEAQVRPQDFSPNVLLRPVYQETILPNIAYVGGGGELAYWLQLRWLFQGLQVPMPALFLRTSAATLPAKNLGHWQELGLSITDLFAPLDPLKARVAKEQASFPVDLDHARKQLAALYEDVLARAVAADRSLNGAVEARKVQALRGLERLEKGMVRGAKREQATALQRMDAAHAALFPAGGLQERRDNVLPALAAQGMGELDRLLEALDPFDQQFTLFVEG